MKRIITSICIMLLAAAAVSSCTSIADKKIVDENKQFLEAPFARGVDKETFRVLIMSDKYLFVQTNYQETIERVNDPGGDRYICDEVKKYDKIDESREGMYHVSLYPDRGTLMKVRPYKPLNLIELDNVIIDDLQRWSFKFPKMIVQPTNLYIKYRIVLRKRQSDAQIIKEVEKKMMSSEEEEKNN
jgi:hypothetical protein